jgi:hypothetical protein
MERKDEMMGRFREALKDPMLIFALASPTSSRRHLTGGESSLLSRCYHEVVSPEIFALRSMRLSSVKKGVGSSCDLPIAWRKALPMGSRSAAGRRAHEVSCSTFNFSLTSGSTQRSPVPSGSSQLPAIAVTYVGARQCRSA